MKFIIKIVTLFIVSFALFIDVSAQPTLKSADIAVIAVNTDLDDQFAFVALADIPGNSVIFITDEGWDDNDFVFDGAEECFMWTVSSSGISAGTIIRFTDESTIILEISNSAHGTITRVNGDADLSLSAGDQIFIYQTDNNQYDGTIQRLSSEGVVEAGMIYAYNGDNSSPSTYGWLNAGNAHTSAASQVPDNMTVLTTSDGTGNASYANANGMLTQDSVYVINGSDTTLSPKNEYDNYRYNGPITPATKDEWLARLHTVKYWLACDPDTLPLWTGKLVSDWVVLAANAEPDITVVETLYYKEGDGEISFDETASLSDSDGDTEWDGGTLEIQITNNQNSDAITIPDNIGGITTDGLNILNNNTIIGTLSASEGNVSDGSVLTVTFNSNATNSSVQDALRAVSYINSSEDPSEVSRIVVFTATDANNGSASDTVTVDFTAINDAPTVVTNNGLTLDEGATKTIPLDSLEADDVDNDNSTLTYTITSELSNGQLENSDNSGASIASFTQQDLIDGKIEYVHDGSNTTSDVFTYKVSDGTDELTSQIFSITINPVNDDTPIITANQSFNLSENATNNKTVGTVEATDTDGSTTYSSWTITSGNADGIFAINSSTGEITVADNSKLDYEVKTSYTLSLTVSDGINTSLETDVTVNITNVNESPIITSNATLTATEDVKYTYTVVATDPENDELTYKLTNNPSGMSISGNVISWTPAEGVTTSGEVTLTVGDGDLIDTEKFTIAVASVNDAPVITSNATLTATEDVKYTYTVVATDPENDELTYKLTNNPSGMSISGNVISWTPTEGVTTSGEVTLTVSDGDLTDTEKFTIAVVSVNDAPDITSNATLTATEDIKYTYTVVATDPENDELTYKLTNNPSGMSISGNVISWTPTEGVTTSGEVTLTVSDGSLTDTETFTVLVTSVNDVPVLESVSQDFVIGSNDTLLITLDSLVATDEDGDELEVVLTSDDGNSTIEDNKIITGDLTGVDSITVSFSVSDGVANSNVITRKIEVVNTVSINQLIEFADEGYSLVVAPTPTKYDGKIIIESEESDDAKITLYRENSSIIATQIVELDSYKQTVVSWNIIKNLPRGIYYVDLSINGDRKALTRLIKIK